MPEAPTPKTDETKPYSYFVSQVAANGCESERAEIIITIKAAPAKPTTKRFIPYCKDDPNATALSAAGASGATIKWYDEKGSVISPPLTPTTKISWDVFYTVTQTVNVCESDTAKIKHVVLSAACCRPDQ